MYLPGRTQIPRLGKLCRSLLPKKPKHTAKLPQAEGVRDRPHGSRLAWQNRRAGDKSGRERHIFDEPQEGISPPKLTQITAGHRNDSETTSLHFPRIITRSVMATMKMSKLFLSHPLWRVSRVLSRQKKLGRSDPSLRKGNADVARLRLVRGCFFGEFFD